MNSQSNGGNVHDDVRAIAEDIARRLCRERHDADCFDADTVAEVVEEAKQQGLIDQSLNTNSIVVFCRALRLGVGILEHARPNGGGGAEPCRALFELIVEALGPGQTQTR